MSDQTTPVEETLAWEAGHRRTASAAGVIGGLTIVIGLVVQALAVAGAPQISLLQALQHHAAIATHDLRFGYYQVVSDHVPTLLLSAVLQGGGYLSSMLAVGFLYRSTRARRPQLRPWVLYSALIGLGLLAVSTAVVEIVLTIKAHAFVTGHDLGHHAADNVTGSGLFVAAGTLQAVSGIPVAAGVLLLSLNAMRTGLLTRFLGTLGIVAGVAFILIAGTPLHVFPFVFWLIGLGVLIGGHWPNGVPPSWASGEAMAWPTAAEVREQREAARGGGGRPARGARGGGPAKPQRPAQPDGGSIPAGAPTAAPHSSSNKRKRKRR